MIALGKTVRLIKDHLKVSIGIITALERRSHAIHSNLIVSVVASLSTIQRHIRPIINECHCAVLGVSLGKITIGVTRGKLMFSRPV